MWLNLNCLVLKAEKDRREIQEGIDQPRQCFEIGMTSLTEERYGFFWRGWRMEDVTTWHDCLGLKVARVRCMEIDLGRHKMRTTIEWRMTVMIN